VSVERRDEIFEHLSLGHARDPATMVSRRSQSDLSSTTGAVGPE
jgi:hypothetical protein